MMRSLQVVAAAVVAAVPAAWAFDLSGCSSQNTGSGSGSFNTYASLGKCHDACVQSYAFAIVQGSTCWCSNYAPGVSVATTDCNEPCPGYPYEFCGAPDSGLFGYLALNNKPSGTQSVSSAAAAATATSTGGGTTATKIISEKPETWTIPYASIKTVLGSAQTVTVTPTPITTPPPKPSAQDNEVVAAPSQDSFWGNTGKVAGTFTVVGLLIAGLVASAVFFCWRRWRRQDDVMTVTSNEDGPTANNGAPYMVDRRRSNLTLATAGLAGLTRGSSHDRSPTETKTPAQVSRRGSIPMAHDQRLNPVALWNAHPNGSHVSVASFQDERDYSRPVLHIRNPDM